MGTSERPNKNGRVRITKTLAQNAEPGPRSRFFWDTEILGFGLRVTPKGTRSFVFRYTDASGREHLLTLGRLGRVTAEEARDMARKEGVRVARGSNPVFERAKARTVRTLAEFFEECYMPRHADLKKKKVSADGDRMLFRVHLDPLLGHLPLANITTPQVAALHADLADRPYVANRALALLSTMYALAAKWGEIPEGVRNPAHGVERYPEEPRERMLTPDELAKLGKVLDESEAATLRGEFHDNDGNRIGEPLAALRALRFLLTTGLRKNEALGLRWSEVDFAHECLHLEDSKTGKKTVPLASEAVEFLRGLPREEFFVFPAERRKRKGNPKGHFVGLPRVWERIRARAGLGRTRLHDLRHTVASYAVEGGAPLATVGALLGHADTRTTQRYAHVRRSAAHDVANLTAGKIAAMLAAPVPRPEERKVESILPRVRRSGSKNTKRTQ